MMATLLAAMFVHAEEGSALPKQETTTEATQTTTQTATQAANQQSATMLQPMGMTIRIGNSYIVNQSVMNSRAYMGYLQNTSPEVYGRFKSGYVTAMTGWGLFAAGPILTLCIGLPVWISGDPCIDDHYDSHKVALHAGFGIGSIVVGMGSFVAGVTCLGVGYAKMHRSAEIYNFHCANKPTTYWSLQSSANGLGLALHF